MVRKAAEALELACQSAVPARALVFAVAQIEQQVALVLPEIKAISEGDDRVA
jgi:hypothetical protein